MGDPHHTIIPRTRAILTVRCLPAAPRSLAKTRPRSSWGRPGSMSVRQDL